MIFDVNRFDAFKGFIPPNEDAQLNQLQSRTDLPYRLTVISNLTADTRSVAARSQAAHGGVATSTPLGLEWPLNVYSLSHVAIPFAPDDPIYGDGSAARSDYAGLRLGDLNPRGETNVLTVSLSQLMRLRHNPFFAYVEQRIDTHDCRARRTRSLAIFDANNDFKEARGSHCL